MPPDVPPLPPDPSGFSLPHNIDGGDGSTFAGDVLSQEGALYVHAEDAIRMLLHESGLNPALGSHVKHADGSPVAAGIYQALTRKADGSSALPGGMSLAQWEAMSADDQLPHWFAYLQSTAGISGKATLPLSGRDLYWLNFLPATVDSSATDDTIIATSDDNYNTPDGASHFMRGVYTDNAALDHGGKGYISAGDMRLALQDGADAFPRTYARLANLIAGLRGGNVA